MCECILGRNEEQDVPYLYLQKESCYTFQDTSLGKTSTKAILFPDEAIQLGRSIGTT